jgi:superfamily II DNA/RNA helicase
MSETSAANIRNISISLTDPDRNRLLDPQYETSVNSSYDSIDPTLIFVNLAETAEALAAALEARGVRCGQYHKLAGRLEERMDTLERFRRGEIRVIVATDHAAR